MSDHDTITGTHQWVLMQFIPVEVDVDENDPDLLHTFTREGQEELAKEDGIICCWHCKSTLTTDSYYMDCPGQTLAN